MNEQTHGCGGSQSLASAADCSVPSATPPGGPTATMFAEAPPSPTLPGLIVNVSLPRKTRQNGTLYAVVFVHQANVSPWQDPRQVHQVAQLTTYMVPKPPEEINSTTKELALTINYESISLGRLRFWSHMQDAVYSLQQFGFTEKDADEIKGIFVDTNLYFLALTFFVAAFHLLFDFLAFKNDISFWKQKRSMTSLLVLIPAGVGSIIEVWKVKKAFKIQVSWKGSKPTLLAMKYLSYLLYPLCIGGAVYALVYLRWYSWVINSLVNGVYAFGFLFMLPQLFVNFKLKSVAHLPWKAFMYKAFNTFIDDVFAFVITMPTSHRLACSIRWTRHE
ncbi:hypothetical protein CRUP_031824 [Coryphaenoides rupestris]|nr:hypothetical protein CRUP_031824 [Coryphaenoides rupestris]